MFAPGKLFQPRLIFIGKAKRLLKSGAPERYFTWVGTSLTCKHLTRLERPARDIHSGLLRKFLNYGRKKFNNTDPWFQSKLSNCIIFLDRNEREKWPQIFLQCVKNVWLAS